MALVLGLDIGTHSVTGAVFAGTPKKFRLVDFFTEEIPVLVASGLEALQPKDDSRAQGMPQEFTTPLSLDELLQKILTERGLKGADVIAAIDAKDCIIREFPVQFTREEQIAKVVPFTAEEFLPTINLEEFVLEWLKVGEAHGKSNVVIFALKNDVIESRLGLLKRVEVDPIALDIDAAALFNAFALTPVFDAKKSMLLIDMGGTSTKMILIENGRIKKVRAFRSSARVLGPERLIGQPAGAASGGGVAAGHVASSYEAEPLFGDYSIETRFKEIEDALRKLEPAGADALLDAFDDSTPIAILSDEDYAQVQGMAAQDRLSDGANRVAAPGTNRFDERLRTPSEPLPSNSANGGGDFRAYLDRMGIEVQRTLASSQSNIDLICLTGGISAREESVRFFSEEFDVETIRLDFGDSIECDLDSAKMLEVSRFGAVAVGLAMKNLGGDRAGLDFRKGRFRYEHRFSRLKLPLLVASVLCFGFFLQTAFWSYHEYRSFSERAHDFEQESRSVYEAFFFGKPVAEGRDPLVAANEQLGKWSGKGLVGVGKVLPFADALANVADVLDAAKHDLGDIFRIRNMSFDFKVKFRAQGQSKKAEPVGADSVIELMTKNDNGFSSLERAFSKPEKGSKYFDAKTQSKRVQDEYQVSLTLTPKKQALQQLE